MKLEEQYTTGLNHDHSTRFDFLEPGNSPLLRAREAIARVLIEMLILERRTDGTDISDYITQSQSMKYARERDGQDDGFLIVRVEDLIEVESRRKLHCI